MNKPDLGVGESILFALRELYDLNGYARYRMNKFEEYDLYAKNKDFLISDSVITFTDTNGKLMALKPDVTLSIVKNTKDGEDGIRKLYYNENVYRVSKGSRTFGEIMQVGLEAIGRVDEFTVCEVLMLAVQSLRRTGRTCILQLSHLGILSETLDKLGVPPSERGTALRLIGEKNTHELSRLLDTLGIEKEQAGILQSLVSMHGTPAQTLPALSALLRGVVKNETLEEFSRVLANLESEEYADMLRIDFSVISDTRYYNGFVFKGFARGIPTAVLSGGQYDLLMAKMKRCSRAVGFAVYLDQLTQYETVKKEYDVDDVLLYGASDSFSAVEKEAGALRASGRSVLTARTVPQGLRARRILRLTGEGVTDGEAND